MPISKALPSATPKGSSSAPLSSKAPEKNPADLPSDRLQELAKKHLDDMQSLCERATSRKVGDLAKKLIGKGLLVRNGVGDYELAKALPRTRYARARDLPAKARRRAEFSIRRRLNRPCTEGSQAFRRGGDKKTFTPGWWSPLLVGMTGSGLSRTGLNAASSPGSHGYAPPAGVLEGLGVAAGVVAGCWLLDGLDMFNSYLDAVDEQDRWKLQVVVFYEHFKRYIADREADRSSSPAVVYGFRQCQAGLSRCAVFDKEARRSLRRCLAGALKDTGLGTLGTLMGAANTGIKIHSGLHSVAAGVATASNALGYASLPVALASVGIDIWMGIGDISSRKKEYRRHKNCCRQLQSQIEELKKNPTPSGAAPDDRTAMIKMLKGAQKRHRRLKKQAWYDMTFSGVRVGKAALNGAALPLGIAAAVGVGAATTPVGWAAGTVGAAAGTGYTLGCIARSVAQDELRTRTRREQYDGTNLAATTRADDRTARLSQQEPLEVAGTQGYWVGGRAGFAGSYVREVRPETHTVAALDEFAGLLARRPADGRHPDEVVEAHIQDLLAMDNIDEILFNDIERMIHARSEKLRQQGAHPRDIEWQALMARREQYAAVFGLPSDPPKLQVGALLPSFQLACWSARLSGSDDARSKSFLGLLERHQNGNQISLRETNEWLIDEKSLARASTKLTDEQKQSMADRLFRSVPPTLFIEQTNALLKSIDAEVGDRQAFGWQDDNPMLRDLRDFCEFAQAKWLPVNQALLRIFAEPASVEVCVGNCANSDLSTAIRYLASENSVLPPSLKSVDRAVLNAALQVEWAKRFSRDSGGTTCAALAEHCERHRRYAGRPWSRDVKGNFHCDLGGHKVAVISAARMADWANAKDWRQPLPITIRSLAPASAVRWLTAERGAVDGRFVEEAGAAPTLGDMQLALQESERAEGASLNVRWVSLPSKGSQQGSQAEPDQVKQLEEAIGTTCRVALSDRSPGSTLPWAFLKKLPFYFNDKPWELQIDGWETRHKTFEEAVQAYCDAQKLEEVRAVFLTRRPPA